VCVCVCVCVLCCLGRSMRSNGRSRWVRSTKTRNRSLREVTLFSERNQNLVQDFQHRQMSYCVIWDARRRLEPLLNVDRKLLMACMASTQQLTMTAVSTAPVGKARPAADGLATPSTLPVCGSTNVTVQPPCSCPRPPPPPASRSSGSRVRAGHGSGAPQSSAPEGSLRWRRACGPGSTANSAN
jgi:hypothetical protein